jgi:hypothetical protein
MDDRDVVIEQLAVELAAMRDRALNAEADRDAYKLIVVQSLEVGHHLTLERDRFRERYYHALDQLRELRAAQCSSRAA